MHSGPNWTRKRKLKPDEKPQIITKSEEQQAEHHANWRVISDDILSPA